MKLYGIRAKCDWRKTWQYLIVVERDGDAYAKLIRDSGIDYNGRIAKFVPVKILAHMGGTRRQYLTSKHWAKRTLQALKNIDEIGVNVDYFTVFGHLDVEHFEIYEVEMP